MKPHSERSHSIWSPSAWERWGVHCPGSALFTKDMVSPDNEYSARGTWMHEQVNRILNGWAESLPHPSGMDTEANWNDIGFAVEYVNSLIESCSLLEKPLVMHESRLELPAPHDDVFGTCDFLLFDPAFNHLYIVDYKFGHGEVEAEDNGQLGLYGCMAYHEVLRQMPGAKIEVVSLIIVQPAVRPQVKNRTMPVDVLTDWWVNEAQPAIVEAKKEDAALNPHPQACKYCPATGRCPAQKAQAVTAFAQIKDSTDHAENLALAAQMESYIKGVREAALHAATNGERIPGYKLVRGVTHRRWADEEKAERWLASRGLSKAERTVTSVIGIPAAEEALAATLKDNPRLTKNFEALITRPEGKLALAKEKDKRPEVVVGNPFNSEEVKNEDFAI